MAGNIPLLNDSRRHYAEIVNVFYYHGEQRSHCFVRNYFKEYYPYLNISAPDAINNPELVVNKIKNLRYNVHNNITELKELINACVQKSDICNELIENTVKENPDQFSKPASVLIAAGNTAKELNKLNGKFEEVSKNLKAHQYVSTSPEDLEDIVISIAELYYSLNPHDC